MKLYCYYSTQRPIGPGTCPKRPLEVVNYDERTPVEQGAFAAWGLLFYDRPLSAKEVSDYELRPCPDNSNSRHVTEMMIREVGRWEDWNHIPAHQRLTVKPDGAQGHILNGNIAPEQLEGRYELILQWLAPAQMYAPYQKQKSHSLEREEVCHMYPLDAMAIRFKAVEILGIPGLFTTERVNRATVPKGMYAYDMQTSAEDWTRPCLLARHITVEHFGTVLTASPIPLPESGYVDLSPGDLEERNGAEHLTVAEFEQKYLSPDNQPPQSRPRSRQRHSPAMVR